MRKSFAISALLLIMLLPLAAAADSFVFRTDTPVPTATPTPSPTPVPTAVPTPTPTKTPRPTKTPSPTPKPTKTPKPTPTLPQNPLLPWDYSPGKKLNSKYRVSDTEYTDPTISVKVESGRYRDTDYWLARIKIQDASQLRTAAADNFVGHVDMSGVRLAQRVNAVLAIDGDYFYYNGGAGFMVRQTNVIFDNPTGRQDILLIDDQGDFHIVHMPRKGQVSTVINDRRVINALCFGPGLTENGKVLYNDAYGSSYGADWKRQRMAICQTGHLEYLCVCTGSTLRGSAAMTLDEFARFVTSLGVQTAYNLDGGDSAMMVFCGKKYNDLTSTNLRNLSDIVYFASAWEGK